MKFPNRGQFERFLQALNHRGIPGSFVYSVREEHGPYPAPIDSLDTFLETHTERDLENLVITNWTDDRNSPEFIVTIGFSSKPVTEGHLKFFVTYNMQVPDSQILQWFEDEQPTIEKLIEQYTVPQTRISPIVTADTAIDFDRKRREARIRWTSAVISFSVALGTALLVEWLRGG